MMTFVSGNKVSLESSGNSLKKQSLWLSLKTQGWGSSMERDSKKTKKDENGVLVDEKNENIVLAILGFLEHPWNPGNWKGATG